MIGNQAFRVPSVSDRLMISTLQRMYRHFYFRLCDIIDSASLVEMGSIDYFDLRSSSMKPGSGKGLRLTWRLCRTMSRSIAALA